MTASRMRSTEATTDGTKGPGDPSPSCLILQPYIMPIVRLIHRLFTLHVTQMRRDLLHCIKRCSGKGAAPIRALLFNKIYLTFTEGNGYSVCRDVWEEDLCCVVCSDGNNILCVYAKCEHSLRTSGTGTTSFCDELGKTRE